MFSIYRTVPRLGSRVVSRGVKTSIVDWKPIKAKKSRGEGRIGRTVFMGLLILMPVVSFGLGTWQVKRLQWKTNLISRSEHRLSLPPLPLPPTLNPDVVETGEFDYRRVTATGTFRHDQEMLIGPRMHDNKEGYHVITPLERKDGSKLVIFRGWIAKKFADQRLRDPSALPQGEVDIECLLQRKPKKNVFTPEDKPAEGLYYFMSIDEMAKQTQSQPIYIQALLNTNVNGIELLPDQLVNRGIPLGQPGKVNIRNTHFQYILTWYGLSALTTVMLFRLLRTGSTSASGTLAQKLKHARKNQ